MTWHLMSLTDDNDTTNSDSLDNEFPAEDGIQEQKW